MANDRLTKRQARAVDMIAGGAPVEDVAAEIGVTKGTIAAWMRTAVCREEYKECFKRRNLYTHAKARAVLERQMNDQNAWVAQNAARELLNRTESDALGKEEAALRVEIIGAPQLGTPDMDEVRAEQAD